jgi:trehalose synthase
LDSYAPIVGEAEIASVWALADSLKGKSVTHINSTAFGGGVAEILSNMVPLMRAVGLEVHWDVLQGSLEFYKITKKIHNALQGMNLQLTEEEQKIYLSVSKINSALATLESDYVMVHDNQPVAIIDFASDKKNKWLWRCHVDLSTPNLAVWTFLEHYINRYDAAIFSAKEYVISSLRVPKIQISTPAINPLCQKNKDLDDVTIKAILSKYGVNPEKPIITQVGRFDPFKDQLGVIDVYRLVKRDVPQLQLLLIAGMATDDPEGWLFLEKTARHAGEDPDIHLLTDLKGVSDLEVNAFQRASQVALQMSTREGFGLTVTEALWKGVPVVARKVGGIPLQVIDGHDGFLVETVEQAAEKTLRLLKHRAEAVQMGNYGREHVRKNFLIITSLKDYLMLLKDLQ